MWSLQPATNLDVCMEAHSEISGECNPELNYFQYNLLGISDRLKTEEVRRLAYICPEIKCTENIKAGHDLFLALQKKELIMPGNYDYIWLIACSRLEGRILSHFGVYMPAFSYTMGCIANKMLDRLLKTGREEVVLHLMKWMWRSLPTFPAHLME